MITRLYNYEPKTLTLTACCLLATYLVHLCWTAPNPAPANPYPNDRVGKVRSFAVRRMVIVFLWICHALLTLTFPHPPTSLCPRPQNLGASLFTWSTYTAVCLSLIFIAVPIRLLAFAQLGQNFTFQLAKPKGLVTTGLYAYVQHPSYPPNLITFFVCVAMLLRVDGVIGCWLPSWVAQWEGMDVVGVLLMVALAGASCWGLMIRVRDEEEMLRKEFGKEWEVYHQKTKRFVPGLF